MPLYCVPHLINFLLYFHSLSSEVVDRVTATPAAEFGPNGSGVINTGAVVQPKKESDDPCC